MCVLVTGVTGFVAERLVPTLVERGHDVRALVRNATGYDVLNGVEVTEDRFSEPGSVGASVDAIDAAYYLVYSMYAAGDFEERDRRTVHNFANAGGERGVDCVVCLGDLGEERDDLSKRLRSRWETERICRRALVLEGTV